MLKVVSKKRGARRPSVAASTSVPRWQAGCTMNNHFVAQPKTAQGTTGSPPRAKARPDDDRDNMDENDDEGIHCSACLSHVSYANFPMHVWIFCLGLGAAARPPLDEPRPSTSPRTGPACREGSESLPTRRLRTRFTARPHQGTGDEARG